MGINLWQNCLSCKDKCCKWSVACPLFVTSQEMSKIEEGNTIEDFNKKYPCAFFDKNELCAIHNVRPVDCRFFPFDVMNISGKFFWVIWDVNCLILKQKNFEPYLEQFETELIPNFQENLENYSKFRLEEFIHKYKFQVIREIKFQPAFPHPFKFVPSLLAPFSRTTPCRILKFFS